MAGVGWTPGVYGAAAVEHISLAKSLRKTGTPYADRYVFYLSGLAIECLLRSIEAPNTERDPSHDLQHWFNKTGFVGLVPPGQMERLKGEIPFVCTYWRSLDRYLSTDDLRSALKTRRLYSSKGRRFDDPLAYADRLYQTATAILTVIVARS